MKTLRTRSAGGTVAAIIIGCASGAAIGQTPLGSRPSRQSGSEQAQPDAQTPATAPGVADRPSITQSGNAIIPGAPLATQPNQQVPATSPPKTLTGSWGGMRTRLADSGIKIVANEIFDATYNMNGGNDQLFRGAGQFLIGATFDTNRLFGLKGGTFQLTVVNRHGHSLQDDAGLGLLQAPQAVFGRGRITRLTHFWYEQDLGKTQLKVGRFNHGDDFNVAPLFFQNLALSGPASGHLTGTYLYNLPVSSWGARLRHELTRAIHINVALFESNPVNLREDRGFYFGFKGRTGMILAGEVQWTPLLGANHDLKGVYKVGLWHDSSNSNDLVSDVDGNIQALTGRPFRLRGHHNGVTADIEQQLIAAHKDGAGGLSLGFIYARIDDETNRLHSKGSVRVSYTGLIPSLPTDDLSFGIARTQINDRLTEAQEAQIAAGRTLEAQSDEYTSELSYGLHVTDYLTLRPGAQLIHHPGGYRSRHDIGILETRAIITF
jgi:porin